MYKTKSSLLVTPKNTTFWLTPSLSNSANTRDDLSSKRVSPPNIDAKKTPSSFKTLFISRRQPGRLLTQWRLKQTIKLLLYTVKVIIMVKSVFLVHTLKILQKEFLTFNTQALVCRLYLNCFLTKICVGTEKFPPPEILVATNELNNH